MISTIAQSGPSSNPTVLFLTPLILVVLFLLLRLPQLLRPRPKLSDGADPPISSAQLGLVDDFIVWAAQGFGSGRVPIAPGTFGSLLGLLWFALLATTGSAIWFGIGLLGGLAASVWFCGAAEKILRMKDPGSIVLDEITAVPICFLPWVSSEYSRLAGMPSAEFFFGPSTWLLSLTLFGLFRLFDVWKPWPIRASQKLPRGWGVMIDDVVAAAFVALLGTIALV